MTRVLIVDDSVVFRKLLTEALGKHPGITVVGAACNGREAISKVRLLHPDLMVLDVEMPEMDGLATLDELRKQHLRTGVIMFSTLTSSGAKTTIEALSKGAFDFVPKPTGTGAFSQSVRCIRQELIPRIEAFGQRHSGSKPGRSRPAPVKRKNHDGMAKRAGKPNGPHVQKPVVRPVATGAHFRAEAVAIGVSTGGPNALNEVIPRFPSSFRLPVFLVQHMPPIFTTQLASRLNHKSRLNVVEAQDGMVVTPGTVYLAPGDYHMEVARENKTRVIRLNQGPPVNSCRPAVDVLFMSVSRVYGDRVVAAVLTGMGQDGFEGARMLKQKKARIIAQDRETSVVWGMPKFIVEAGIADRVVPLGSITSTIMELSGQRF